MLQRLRPYLFLLRLCQLCLLKLLHLRLRLPARADAKRSPRQGGFADAHTVLYDLHADPRQLSPCENPEAEAAICEAIRAEMALHEAPAELYDRFDLS